MVAMGLVVPEAEAAPPAPSGDQLTSQLHLILNRAADRTARINELADPSAITGADNIAALEDVFGWAYTWKVINPAAGGDTMTAQLAITLNDHSNRQGQVKTTPLSYAGGGNHWKLSKASVCSLAKQFQTSC